MRRLSVLLLMAAVLSMHGVPAVSAEPGPASGAVASQQAGHAAHGGELVSATASGGLADGLSDRGVPGHDAAAHALSLCLVVLLAGLPLLPAASVVRIGTSAVAEDRTPGGVLRRFRLPRPRAPDLAAFCLLRI